MPTVFSVNGEGTLKLHNSHFEQEELSVWDICDYGLTATQEVFCDLDPTVYDVDIGQDFGAPYGFAPMALLRRSLTDSKEANLIAASS